MEIIYRHFDSLPSTNDWAKAQIETFPQEALTVITAQAQTAGRGRYGRRWISPSGENLYSTFVFFAEEQDPLTLTHLLALSLSHILQERGIASRIKWPNDLLVKQKKIGGILCETVPPSGIVIGVGVNVNMPPEQLAAIDQPATSLLCETGATHGITPLLHALTERFAADLKLYLEKGFAPFSPLFQTLLLNDSSLRALASNSKT